MEENESLDEELEKDDAEEDSSVKEPDFSGAVVWGTDWTVETIASQIAKKNIDLNPIFQRRDAWNGAEKSKLVESLMLGIPVPPIVLAEDKKVRNHYIVIDGKQRLLSIAQFYCKSETVNFQENGINFDELKLSGLKILDNINGKTYGEVPKEYLDNIDNETIRTVVIKNWPNDDFLYNVFLRLNTGSKKLSPQELRQALKPGEFLSYLDSASGESEWFRKLLGNKGPDKRMRDVELALRFYSFKYNFDKYKGNLRTFMDESCDLLNNQWKDKSEEYKNMFSELENAIKFSYNLFQENNGFGRYNDDGEPVRKFNRCVYELFTFYFSDPQVREVVSTHSEVFKKTFIELNKSTDFKTAIDLYPKQTQKVVTRFNMFTDVLRNVDKDNLLTNLKHYESSGVSIEVRQYE